MDKSSLLCIPAPEGNRKEKNSSISAGVLNITIMVFLLLTLLSCKKEEVSGPNVNHFFTVRNNGADLPVLVKGNTSGKTFLIYIHGGPETGAIAESNEPGFWEKLREKYAMVYYDQRGIGMSNGNFDESTLTIEQYVDDLDKIISVLKNRYGNEIGVFLLGGSWGGYVGTAYISTANYQSKLKGWIEIGGAHNMQLIWKELPKQITHIARQQLSRHASVEEWNSLLHFSANFDTTAYTFDNWLNLIGQYTHITELLEKDRELDQRKVHVKVPVGVNVFTLWANDNINKTGIKLLKKYYNTSLTPRLSTVMLPCRFFWGQYDCASPPALAYDAYNTIGTPLKDKKVIIFDNAEHTILLTKPNELLHEIYLFVDAYQ
jgi:pimeloyl-ACP methyl ester carboxylesterase